MEKGVAAAIAPSLEPREKDIEGSSFYRPLYASAEPSSEQGREACLNEKSMPWLPEVSLPDAKSPGRAALGWRPRWLLSQPLPPGWLTGSLVTLLLAAVLGRGSQRRGRQWLALVAASAPCVVGFALAHHRLSFLAEGLSQTWWCIPREGIFQRNAQLARDVLTLGALASLPSFVRRSPRRARRWLPLVRRWQPEARRCPRQPRTRSIRARTREREARTPLVRARRFLYSRGRRRGGAATACQPRSSHRVPTSLLPLSTTVERGPGGEAPAQSLTNPGHRRM